MTEQENCARALADAVRPIVAAATAGPKVELPSTPVSLQIGSGLLQALADALSAFDRADQPAPDAAAPAVPAAS